MSGLMKDLNRMVLEGSLPVDDRRASGLLEIVVAPNELLIEQYPGTLNIASFGLH